VLTKGRTIFPVIIDCYRDGEISTDKESKMLEGFVNLHKQVILTSTLKTQEYSSERYKGMEQIHPIDFSEIQTNHILKKEFAEAFKIILEEFDLTTAAT